MKVSVIVPVYNVEDYIGKCLDSLVKQTLEDIEIIVVNDGSPDNSQEIIDKYAKEYKNIRSYVKKNGGLSDARNYGIKKAKGDYLSFIDSDDYITEDMLEKMYNKATKEDLDIVVCDSVEVYDDGSTLHKLSNFHYSDDDVKNYIISPPMACIRLYKKELFDKVEFTKGIYYEDLNLTPILAKYTKKIGFIEEGLYYYVQRSNSIMKQKEFNDKLLDIFRVLENDKKELVKEYPEEVEYLYIGHLLRTAVLRFLEYEGTKEYLNRIVKIMKTNYPNYRDNYYYKKSSKKFKMLCTLAINKQWWLLKLIKKATGK